jgi:hypothetical protein
MPGSPRYENEMRSALNERRRILLTPSTERQILNRGRNMNQEPVISNPTEQPSESHGPVESA